MFCITTEITFPRWMWSAAVYITLQGSLDVGKEFDLYQPCRAPLYPLKFFSLWVQTEWINHNGSVPVGAESQHLSLSVLCSSLDDERRSPCGCGTWQLITQRWTILPLREEKRTLIISDLSADDRRSISHILQLKSLSASSARPPLASFTFSVPLGVYLQDIWIFSPLLLLVIYFLLSFFYDFCLFI